MIHAYLRGGVAGIYVQKKLDELDKESGSESSKGRGVANRRRLSVEERKGIHAKE